MTTPTMWPVPSEAYVDLRFNSAKLDEFITSSAEEYTDRLGQKKPTVVGIVSNLSILGKPYATVALAQADIDSGKIPLNGTFTVVSSSDGRSVDIYTNTAGVATPTGKGFADADAVNEAISLAESVSERVPSVIVPDDDVPLYVDEAEQVPVWLENGLLNAKGMHDDIAKDLSGRVFSKGLIDFNPSSGDVPLFVDEADNVPLWLTEGMISGKGLSQQLLSVISLMLSPSFQLREAPLSASKPISTDGRTLFKFKSKLGRLINNENIRPTVMFTGDSWSEYVAIPQAMYNLFQSKYAVSNSSFISVNGQFMLNGVSFNKTEGWVLYDASAVSVAPTNGCGPDGQSISTSAADQTITIENQVCTQVNILYQDLNGTFRYRIDGGSWVSVPGNNTGTMVRIPISSLSDAPHKIEIDTTGNAGNVAIHGFWCPRQVRGIELQKCGNAGITGSGITNYYTQIQQFANFMQPDLIFVILGTNDFRLNKSVASYIDGIRSLVGAYKSAYQETGVVLISPAQCNATGSVPTTEFRNAMAGLAMELGVEFFNFHDDWDKWSVMNGYGVWVDSLHLNNSGAASLAKSLDRHFTSL
ncbi:SGNH/GDSL hydrolase family protein [Serratia odorifera]|uniref:SGNH/GDSL hydrolase family protein n=1 Tax=Serratia odorifera TaxID=618 RepID=UPI003D2D315C